MIGNEMCWTLQQKKNKEKKKGSNSKEVKLTEIHKYHVAPCKKQKQKKK